MNFKFNIYIIIVIISCFSKNTFSQEKDSLINDRKKNSIIIGSNFVYNYFSNKTLVELFAPYGKIPNSPRYVYYWNYKYVDTHTFDLSVQYNKRIKRSTSVSYGLRFDQQKSCQKTFLYVDSLENVPDLKNVTITSNNFSVPLMLNYYTKRFKFNAGLSLNILVFRNSTYLNTDNSKLEFKEIFFGGMHIHESIVFKIFDKKLLYFQLGAFHNLDLFKYQGYNNFFTLGLNYELDLKNKSQ